LSKILSVAVAIILIGGLPKLARAQNEDPVDIEVGTKRVGGPGTEKQRKADDAWDKALLEEDTPMTEETLPPKGDKKRMPGLHKLAQQYFGGGMWKDACDKYDQIIDEGGDEALALKPEAKTNAGRAYYECAQIAFRGADYEKTERILKKSEKYQANAARNQALRHKVKREKFRRLMGNGDVNGAIAIFKEFQAEQPSEDERIWMGEEIAKRAWEAYEAKDKIGTQDLIAKGEDIAPMNTELRKLKDKIKGEGSVLMNVLTYGVLAILVVVLGTQLSKWRGRQKVRRAGGSPFDVDPETDSEEV
jgi:hypothetical protein